MNKISFKVSLVFLIWVSALIPVSLLTYNFTQDKIAQFVELQQQKLVNSATKSANKSKQYLDESISAIDKLAIDGGIIVSASLDIMSVKAVKKLKSFLSNYAEFESIMLLDADLFQMEAYPTSALKIPLAAINKEFTARKIPVRAFNRLSSCSTVAISPPGCVFITPATPENWERSE